MIARRFVLASWIAAAAAMSGLAAAARADSTAPAAPPAPKAAPSQAAAAALAPSWQVPAAEDVRNKVLAWLDAATPDATMRAKAREIWSAGPEGPAGFDLLERLVRTAALASPSARQLADLCSRPRPPAGLPPQPWSADKDLPDWLARNLRLWYGRWLVQQSLYDEALEQLDRVRPEEVADPASLLFYQGVVYHRLLNPDAAVEAIGRLLEHPEQGPKRYEAVARLMEADLRGLKEDSLDHIARRMEDIERRLDLGRAGPKVRKIQDGVIASLDKMIKELESRLQQQDASASQGALQPNRPANESVPMAGKGPGEVTQRKVGSQSGWGNLPPRAREEAMQQIGRQFPSHYRDVIEQYFRKLATEGSP